MPSGRSIPFAGGDAARKPTYKARRINSLNWGAQNLPRLRKGRYLSILTADRQSTSPCCATEYFCFRIFQFGGATTANAARNICLSQGRVRPRDNMTREADAATQLNNLAALAEQVTGKFLTSFGRMRATRERSLGRHCDDLTQSPHVLT